MAATWVYMTATVVGVCAIILVVTLSIIICWLIIYCKHAKVRARKSNGSTNRWKDPSALSTVSVQTKPRHAHTYHGQSFKPNAAMDTSGIYIFGVSGTLGGLTGSKQFQSNNMNNDTKANGTISSTSSFHLSESVT